MGYDDSQLVAVSDTQTGKTQMGILQYGDYDTPNVDVLY